MSAPSNAPQDDPLKVSDRARGQILLGVILALLLGALDQTIVSTAGPAIQTDLKISSSLYTWLTIGYLVSSTVVVAIYGRLGDLYGRKLVILIGMALFIAAVRDLVGRDFTDFIQGLAGHRRWGAVHDRLCDRRQPLSTSRARQNQRRARRRLRTLERAGAIDWQFHPR